MTGIEKALTRLHDVEAASRGDYLMQGLDARAKVAVTLAYIVAVLSFGLTSLSGILLFAVYPVVGAAMGGLPYGRLFRQSLMALPFIAFVGIFNPVFEREPMLTAFGLVISRGWVEFVSIILRGLLTVQAVILLVATTGFQGVCRGLGRMGVPDLFTTQLLLVYRYIYVLVDEAARMDRARRSRSYGRKGYGLRMWGTFVGQLLIRTVNRAERVHRAMTARGFDGHLRALGAEVWTVTDTWFTLGWIALFVTGRLCDFSGFLNFG